LIARDPALAADLARRALAPLDQLSPGARERLRETLAAWLDAQGHARTAAETLHVHVQTLRYRLGRLRDVFGDALDDPQRRLELALALRIDALP
jgi:DNA-binding PucR family transcriptional regulator